MKIKILVIPLIITVAVIFFIWLIYPAYSNGVDGVKENLTKLKTEQKKLSDLRSENENIINLSDQISSLPQKEILYSFIPEDAKEEEIINSLSRLASDSGLLLFDATVNQPVKERTSVVSLDSEKSNTLTEPQIKNLSTEIKLAGNYESIKNFLKSVGNFARSNDFKKLDISKNISKGDVTSDLGALVVDASVDFNFLDKSKLTEDSIFNSVFTSPKLDAKIIDEIKSQKSFNNFQINIGQKGRSNLFQ